MTVYGQKNKSGGIPGSSNSIANITYVSANGSDTTGLPDNQFFPYATMQAGFAHTPIGGLLQLCPLNFGDTYADLNTAGITNEAVEVSAQGNSVSAGNLTLSDASSGELNVITFTNIFWNDVLFDIFANNIAYVQMVNCSINNLTYTCETSATTGLGAGSTYINVNIIGNIDYFTTGFAKQTTDITEQYTNCIFNPSSTFTLNGTHTKIIFTSCVGVPPITYANGATEGQVIFQSSETTLSGVAAMSTPAAIASANIIGNAINFAGSSFNQTVTLDLTDAFVDWAGGTNVGTTTFKSTGGNAYYNNFNATGNTVTVGTANGLVMDNLYVNSTGDFTIFTGNVGNGFTVFNYSDLTGQAIIEVGDAGSQEFWGVNGFQVAYAKTNAGNVNTHQFFLQNGYGTVIQDKSAVNYTLLAEYGFNVDTTSDTSESCNLTVYGGWCEQFDTLASETYTIASAYTTAVTPTAPAAAGGLRGTGTARWTNAPITQTLSSSTGATPSFSIPTIVYGVENVIICPTDSMAKTSITFDFSNLGKRDDGNFVHYTKITVILTGLGLTSLAAATFSNTTPAGIESTTLALAQNAMKIGASAQMVFETVSQASMIVHT